MDLWVRGRSCLQSYHGGTDTITRILGAIYTVSKPISYNPGVSLPLIISGHGFCGYPWLSRSEGGPFSSAATEELTVLLAFWELYILYRNQSGIILVCHYF